VLAQLCGSVRASRSAVSIHRPGTPATNVPTSAPAIAPVIDVGVGDVDLSDAVIVALIVSWTIHDEPQPGWQRRAASDQRRRCQAIDTEQEEPLPVAHTRAKGLWSSLARRLTTTPWARS
jgi:hypothetical protein